MTSLVFSNHTNAWYRVSQSISEIDENQFTNSFNSLAILEREKRNTQFRFYTPCTINEEKKKSILVVHICGLIHFRMSNFTFFQAVFFSFSLNIQKQFFHAISCKQYFSFSLSPSHIDLLLYAREERSEGKNEREK